MRQLTIFCVLLLWAGLAASQDDWVPPGTYAQPFAPRIATPSALPQALMTPSLALDSPSLSVGASTGTPSSAAGPGVHFNRPLWYAPGVQLNQPIDGSSTSPARAQIASGVATSPERRGFEFGVATFQSSYGVARLMAQNARRKASRLYTNPDVARVNDNNGIVRYGGKTAQVN
jgi:hypothetical protein